MRKAVLSDQLSEREKAILARLTAGLSDQEIAAELFLSFNTVRWYNRQIYNKLGVRNRTEAAAKAPEILSEAAGGQIEIAVLPANTLPASMTSFVGRQQEIADVIRLLESTRLLSITGLGGCGKTRLALQAAHSMLAKFQDGVYFVPLAPLVSTDNILWAVGEQLAIKFYPHSNPLQQLLDHIHKKKLLLVLDNFEHLLDGAEMVSSILRAAPDVRILVTSRERLHLYGETNYTIGGLSVSASNLEPSEAIELFTQRARSVASNLQLNADVLAHVARICQRMEGMPLGIELAATWVDVLSPREIADELESSLDLLEAEIRDVPPGLTSIRASFTRSWNLLEETQKRAFQRLSIFQGGFTRQSAFAVMGVELRTLQGLVNKSLLHYDTTTERYTTHELLRQFAHEQFESSSAETSANEAHARYFADFMAERWSHLTGHRQKTALQEIESDMDNVRAAWEYWMRVGNVAELKKFLHSFWVVYDIRGWYPAGIQLFERAVEVLHKIPTDEAQAVLGWLQAVQGLYYLAGGIYRSAEGSRKGFLLAQEGIQIVERSQSDDKMMLVPLICMFTTASQVNDQTIAFAAAQNCLEIATRLHDEWSIAKAKQFLSIRAIFDADYNVAERLANEALETFDRNGDKWSSSALCIEVLGLLATNQRRFDEAEAWIERGLHDAEEIDFIYSQQTAYWQLGFVASLQEDYSRAAFYWRQALELGEVPVGSPILIGFGGTSKSSDWGGRRLMDV